MFEIGFFEMALIGFVLLVVMGPEKLPEVAKQLAFVIRKARLWLTNMKSEMESQTDGGLQSLREASEEMAQLNQSIAKMGKDVMADVDSVRSDVKDTITQDEEEFLDAGELDLQADMEEINQQSTEPELLDDTIAGKPEPRKAKKQRKKSESAKKTKKDSKTKAKTKK